MLVIRDAPWNTAKNAEKKLDERDVLTTRCSVRIVMMDPFVGIAGKSIRTILNDTQSENDDNQNWSDMSNPECSNCREEVLIAFNHGYCLECKAAYDAGLRKAAEIIKAETSDPDPARWPTGGQLVENILSLII